MTNQERIWKGMEHILKIKEMKKATRDAILEQQFRYLKSEGVKFVGGLPSIYYDHEEMKTALKYKEELEIEEII
ncbi:hypothetical protein LCGC14_1438680 [marine sediment metagenome]|uniref:Uncharacterized protein n=1 Tax=marine sediment metagenome TaxID=412755 RepID=A0A0F9JLW4_9ZZZZ